VVYITDPACFCCGRKEAAAYPAYTQFLDARIVICELPS
jgi:hypothetical protein